MVSLQARALEILFTIRKRTRKNESAPDVAAERAEVAAMAGMFKPLRPIQCSPVDAGGVPAEWVVPEHVREGRAILYIHGGSFLAGSVATHRTLAGNIAIATGARTLLIEYRLAPEHPFPAALDDATAAWEWLLAQGHQPGRLAVAGDSAGASLTLSLLVRLRDAGRPLPKAAVCISPAPDLTFPGASFGFNARKDLILDEQSERRAVGIYLNGADPRQPLASPFYADLRGLPPILIQVGSHELFLSDVESFGRKARESGVDVTLEVWPRMQHDWHFAARILPEARRAIDRIGAYLDRAFGE